MARPLKPKTLDSFPHRCGRDYWDHRLATFEAMYGASGYAFYYKVLEMVYQQDGCTLVLDDDMRRVLMSRLKMRPRRFSEMLEVALRVGLFDAGSFAQSAVITNRDIERNAAAAFGKRDLERERYRRKSGARTASETSISAVLGDPASNQ